MVVTSCLLEAFLACPMKCYLLSKGEIVTGSDYTNWVATRTESYRSEGINRVTAGHTLEPRGGSLESGCRKNASWHFTLNQIVRIQDWEASLQVVQRVPQEGRNSCATLVPIRFVPANKLTSSDKMMAALDALALSKSLGVKASVAKIVHGEKWSVVTVKANTLSRASHQKDAGCNLLV